MADKTDDLIISISTDTANIRRQLKKLEADIAGSTDRVARNFDTMGKKIDGSVARLANTIKTSLGSGLKAWAGAAAGIFTVAEITKAADAYTNVGNRLRALGVEGARVAQTQNEIVAIAMRARAPLDGVAQLYTRLMSTTAELGVTQAAVGVATETITKGFILSGTAAAEAESASKQFSQALASGVLRGDEFNSIMENAPSLAKAIAAEFGVNVSALREMAEAGDLVADRVFNAIIKSAPDIERAFSTSIPTVEQALTNLGTSLATIVGKMDQTVGASQRVAQAFQAMAGVINGLSISDPIADAAGKLADTKRQLSGGAVTTNRVGQAMGGGSPASGREASMLNNRLAVQQAELDRLVAQRIDAVAGAAIEQYGGGAQEGLNFGAGISMPGAPTPMARPTDLGKAKKTGGGGSVPRRTADDRFAADVQAVRDRTAALSAEQQMIGSGLAAQEARRVALDLEQSALYDLREEARRKGATDLSNVQLAPSQIETIRQVSEAYAAQSVALRQAGEAYDEMNDAGRDILGGLVSDLRAGTEGVDALANAFDRLADRGIDNLLNLIFPSGGGGGGLLGALFGGASSAGGIGHAATGGKIRGAGTGRSDSIPMMLSDGEYVVNSAATARFGPLLEAINSGRIGHMADGGAVGVPALPNMGRRGGPSVVYSDTYHIDARGADQAAVSRLERMIVDRDKALPRNVQGIVRQTQIRKTRG